jgi:hypothetical protein
MGPFFGGNFFAGGFFSGAVAVVKQVFVEIRTFAKSMTQRRRMY